MKNKKYKLIRAALIPWMAILLFCASAHAVDNFEFRIVPTLENPKTKNEVMIYEKDTPYLELKTQVKALGASRWVTGLRADLGQVSDIPALAFQGYDASLISTSFNKSQDLLAGQGKWSASGVGFDIVEAAGKGRIIYEKLADAGKVEGSGFGLTVGIVEWKDIYKLDFDVISDALNPSNASLLTSIKFGKAEAVGNQDAKNYVSENYAVFNGLKEPTDPALTLTLVGAAPPAGFKGVKDVIDNKDGNNLTVQWKRLSNIPGDADRTPPVIYDLYQKVVANENEEFNPITLGLQPIYSGTAGKNLWDQADGEGEQEYYSNKDAGLDDLQWYRYVILVKDSSKVNQDSTVAPQHKTTLENIKASAAGKWISVAVKPHDHVPPGSFQIAGATPADKKITLTWNKPAQNADDLDGYVIFRRKQADSNDDPAPPVLTSAIGDFPGEDLSEVNEKDGWTKIDIVGKNTNNYPDTNFDINGELYKYAIFAFDLNGGVPHQQGRNYSVAATIKSVSPGEAPANIWNFAAVRGEDPGAIKISWSNPVGAAYGGVRIVETSNLLEWKGLTPANSPAFDIEVPQDQWPNPPPTGEKLLTKQKGEENTTFYYKAFAFNQAVNPEARVYQIDQEVFAAALPAKEGEAAAGSLSGLRIMLNTKSGDATLTWTEQDIPDDKKIQVYASTNPHDFLGDQAKLIAEKDKNAQGAGGYSDEEKSVPLRFYRVKIKDGSWSPEVVGKTKYTLYKKTEGTGINFISVPLFTNISGNFPKWEMNTDGMKTSINLAAGEAEGAGRVEYIGGFNGIPVADNQPLTAQTEYARLYNPDGTKKQDVGTPPGGDNNFAIIPKVGYQVSVSNTIDWWVAGEVAGVEIPQEPGE